MSIFTNEPVRMRVKAADLARLDDAALGTLDAPRKGLVRAHLAAAEARLEARQAREEHERVAARRNAARADVKLARMEGAAAPAGTDPVAAAKADKALLDMRIAWLRAEVAAAEAREEDANAAAWAAEADYELARARLLVPERGQTDLPAFVKQAETCRTALEDARRRFVKRRAEADAARAAWERHVVGSVPEPV